MIFKSFLFARHEQETKKLVANQVRASITHVIDNRGVDVLLGGSLILDRDLSPRFWEGMSPYPKNVLATVALSDHAKKQSITVEARQAGNSQHLDSLIDSVMHGFAKQNLEFHMLPTK